MGTTKKYTNHNGKEVKVQSGKNVRITDAVYLTVSKHALSKGMKIGRFFEMAAMDRVILESSKPFKQKQVSPISKSKK